MKWLLTKLLDPHTEPSQHWYFLGPVKVRWFGNLQFHAYAAIVFGLTALWPAVTYAFGGKVKSPAEDCWLPHFFWLNPFEWAELHPGQFVLWAFFITSSLPLFVWKEAERFEHWVKREKPTDEKGERQWFETNAKHVENFWKTIGSFFIGVGLLTLAKDKADSTKEGKMEALTKAIQLNTKAITNAGTRLAKVERTLNKTADPKQEEKPIPPLKPATQGNLPPTGTTSSATTPTSDPPKP